MANALSDFAHVSMERWSHDLGLHLSNLSKKSLQFCWCQQDLPST